MRIRTMPAIALVLTIALSGCQRTEDGSSDTAAGTPTPATSSSNSSPAIELPATPAGTWQAPGDLCKIITGEVAARALGHEGTLEANFDSMAQPAGQGIDGCSYRDPSVATGLGTNVRVMKITDEQWGKFLRTAEAQGKLAEFSTEGFEAFVTAENEALVRKGGFACSALNSGRGKFEPKGLVTIAIQAINVAGYHV